MLTFAYFNTYKSFKNKNLHNQTFLLIIKQFEIHEGKMCGNKKASD